MLPNPTLYGLEEELTTNQCAQAIHMNRRTIVAWIHAGDLKATRLPGQRGHYRVLWKDLLSVLRRPAKPKERSDKDS